MKKRAASITIKTLMLLPSNFTAVKRITHAMNVTKKKAAETTKYGLKNYLMKKPFFAETVAQN